jgi:enhancer of polycomb-like protein
MQVPAGSPANGQAQMVAAQALRVAQQQAHLKRQQQGQVATEQMRRTPSQGSPNGAQQVALPMPNGNGPVQAQWNGVIGTPENKNMVLTPGFSGHMQQQLPRLPNGLVASIPNGANGLPATSRLSAPPFSNLQLALQAQQQAQMHQQSPQQHSMPLASSPLPMGMQLQARPGSANSNHHSSPRPGSAQSSHASPIMMTQGLPSPGGARPNGTVNGLAMKQGQRSPMAYTMQAGLKQQQQALQLQQQQQAQMSFGGFVTG